MFFHLIMLAAGFSSRFGSNKLLYEVQGKAMYLHAFEKLEALRNRADVLSVTVVSQYEEIEEAARQRGFRAVHNANSALGISSSLKLGLASAAEVMEEENQYQLMIPYLHRPDVESMHAFLFMVGDQPYLRVETLEQMLNRYEKNRILQLSANGRRGNPVIFGACFLPELLELTGDTGGKQVIRCHPDAVDLMEADPAELLDIDRI